MTPKQRKFHKPWHNEARAMRESGATLNQIAAKFESSKSYISIICKGAKCPIVHKRYPNHELEFITRVQHMKYLGWTYRQIAIETSKTIGVIAGICHRHK